MTLLFLAAPALAQSEPADSPGESETPGTAPISMVQEAYVSHRKGEYEEAIKGYTKIIQRRGLTRRERAITYLLRGEAKRDAGRLDDSILDFSRALRQWPGYPQAHFFRGRVYEQQAKLTEAYADIARAVELEPSRESYNTTLTILKKRMTDAGLTIQHAATPPDPVAPNLPDGEG
ncbi:tetratricopeptide repeat protein [Deltaproteobacteria bacterium OttesenSCG-928-M10]|nr:tetratricopeptide repeat protein [Deltaproteobacteria bacterium OttesenSCG-928-M10]